MPLLFMVILPQIDLRNTVSSQAANRLQGGFVSGKRKRPEGSLVLRCSLAWVEHRPICPRRVAIGHCQMACDRRPSCLPMLHVEAEGCQYNTRFQSQALYLF